MTSASNMSSTSVGPTWIMSLYFFPVLNEELGLMISEGHSIDVFILTYDLVENAQVQVVIEHSA